MSPESPETLSEIELKFALEIVEFEGFINYGTPIDMTATTSDGEIVDIVITESRIEEPIFRQKKQKKTPSTPTNHLNKASTLAGRFPSSQLKFLSSLSRHAADPT